MDDTRIGVDEGEGTVTVRDVEDTNGLFELAVDVSTVEGVDEGTTFL